MALDPYAFARGMAAGPKTDITEGPRQQTANLMNMMRLKQSMDESRAREGLRNAMAGVDFGNITPDALNKVAQYDLASASTLATMQQKRDEAAAAKLEKVAGVYLAAHADPSDETADAVLFPALASVVGQDAAGQALAEFKAVPLAERKNFITAKVAQSPQLLGIILPKVSDLMANERAAQDRALEAQKFQVTSGQKATELDQAERGLALEAGRLEVLRAAEARAASSAAANRGDTPSGLPLKEHAKLVANAPRLDAANATFNKNADETVAVIDQLLNTDPKVLAGVVGPLDSLKPQWMRTAAENDALTLLESVRGDTFVTALNEMRAASPTGAAVGNVSNAEGDKLQKSQAPLSETGSVEKLRKALEAYRAGIENSRQIINNAHEATFSWRDNVPAATRGSGNAGPAPAGLTQEEWDAMDPEDRKLWQTQ